MTRKPDQKQSDPLVDLLDAQQAWIDHSPASERLERAEVGAAIRQHVENPDADSLLIIDRATLTSLPVLPHAMHMMVMFCPRLVSFPDLLHGEQLTSLTVADCPSLTTLPQLGHLQQLRSLDLTGLPLVSVPPGLLDLHRDCSIVLEVGGLTDTALSRLADTIYHPRYQGPQVRYAIPAVKAMSPLVVEEVTLWRDEAVTENAARLDPHIWSQLLAHVDADAFAHFLSRLRKTKDYFGAEPALKVATQQRVVKLLEQLQYDSAARNDCFNLAEEAVTTCADRVALGLLDMEMRCLTSRTQEEIHAGKHDASPQRLVELCKGQYRLKTLERLTKEKSAVMDTIDEVEFYLGHVLALSEHYALPVSVKSMLYPNVTGITPADLVAARSALGNEDESPETAAKNNQAYLSFLASSPLMHSLLTRVAEPEMTAVRADGNEQIAREKSAMYEQLDALQAGAASTSVVLQESNRLMQTFNAVETTIRVKTTLPVLLRVLSQHGISPTL